tara:strand:- start:4 stop:501 length:498 start_codon:yes stop_codon:yes gene_type:complete
MKVKPIAGQDAHMLESDGSHRLGFDVKPSKEEPLNVNDLSGRLFGGRMPLCLSGLASSFLPFSHLPLPLKCWVRAEGRSIEEVSAIVSSLDQDGKGVPVLVKHYLKLNGSFVSFGVDLDFADALHGLIVVDMRDMTDAHLRRYFGEKGMKRMIRTLEETQTNYLN